MMSGAVAHASINLGALDGPAPRYSDEILNILAAQCVKATFFLVGEMARAHPSTARRIFAEGHTIGTHSEDHPSRFRKLPRSLVEWEIDKGILDVGAALGDARRVAPFFRVPGLARSDVIDSEPAARVLVDFGSDTVADDWHHRISPKKIIALAMNRLEARGKGILLLHARNRRRLARSIKGVEPAGFSYCPCSADLSGSVLGWMCRRLLYRRATWGRTDII
jgi:peptidoglycan/xylan/chitin deacetylase (PgdA/CDA1 family)